MKKDNFEDVKIKMVMKLKKLSRKAAVAEIARMDAVRKAAKDAEREAEEARRRRMRGGDASGVDINNALVHNEDLLVDDMISAEEFFGG